MTKAQEELIHRRRGWWIRLARERKGMTLSALAEAVGYSEGQGTVSLWERGRRGVPSGKFPVIAKTLGLSHRLLVDPPITDEERLETDAFDETPPAVMTDAERRRRRAWWLYVARHTAGLGLDQARDAMANRGFRSERGNLVALWEDPRAAMEPGEAQLRALAEVYRMPARELVDLWNNPPATDEEEMAARRGVDIVAVDSPAPARRDGERRRRTA